MRLAADAWRMNALTGSPLTSETSKGDGSGLVKQQGHILLVPQGSGDVTQGQVRCCVTIQLCWGCCVVLNWQCTASTSSRCRHSVLTALCTGPLTQLITVYTCCCVFLFLLADVELSFLGLHEFKPLHRQINR